MRPSSDTLLFWLSNHQAEDFSLSLSVALDYQYGDSPFPLCLGPFLCCGSGAPDVCLALLGTDGEAGPASLPTSPGAESCMVLVERGDLLLGEGLRTWEEAAALASPGGSLLWGFSLSRDGWRLLEVWRESGDSFLAASETQPQNILLAALLQGPSLSL